MQKEIKRIIDALPGMVERMIYKVGDDIAVSISRSFERLEERIDAGEARIYSRLSDIEDGIHENLGAAHLAVAGQGEGAKD